VLCYIHTMKKTVEEPDLVPGPVGPHLLPPLGNSLQTAVALFSVRSLTRSRQHRVAFAFYLAFVFGLAFSLFRSELALPASSLVSMDLVISTFLMMFFAVAGLGSVFSLPISLTANWVLRTTQIRPSEKYVAATRRTLLLLAVLPTWLLAAALSLRFGPFPNAAGHLAVLALVGCNAVELCLVGFYKVPFTCSYLPGKANVQVIFWGFLVVMLAVVIPCAEFELSALHQPLRFFMMLFSLSAARTALWAQNQRRAKSAVLHFEELPDEIITTLGLSA